MVNGSHVERRILWVGIAAIALAAALFICKHHLIRQHQFSDATTVRYLRFIEVPVYRLDGDGVGELVHQDKLPDESPHSPDDYGIRHLHATSAYDDVEVRMCNRTGSAVEDTGAGLRFSVILIKGCDLRDSSGQIACCGFNRQQGPGFTLCICMPVKFLWLKQQQAASAIKPLPGTSSQTCSHRVCLQGGHPE